MILLPAAERQAQPWKNGGGVTREVALSPAGAGFEDFDWRISIAEVASDGPFSQFPGIDRTLTLLAGRGIALDVAGALTLLKPGSPPFSFPGDMPTHGDLLDGPITDLNVMTRRGIISHHVAPLCAGGQIAVENSVLIWISGEGRVTTPSDSLSLNPLDALQAKTPQRWTIESADFLAYLVSFR